MKRKTSSLTAAVLTVALSAGCATAGRDTAIGALAGTAAGAGVGALVGGKKGALIGAGVGAVAGGSVGLYLDKQRKELEAAKVAEVKQTENGLLLQMKNDILFDVNSDGVKPAGLEDHLARPLGYVDRVRIRLSLETQTRVSHAGTSLADERAIRAAGRGRAGPAGRPEAPRGT